MENDQDLLTEAELADWLKVSKKLLQKMRYSGTGPKYKKIGSSVRYKKKDINDYLDASTRRFTREEA